MLLEAAICLAQQTEEAKLIGLLTSPSHLSVCPGSLGNFCPVYFTVLHICCQPMLFLLQGADDVSHITLQQLAGSLRLLADTADV